MTLWNVSWFLLWWLWLSILIALIFGELVRRGRVR